MQGNLGQLVAAANQYYLENGTSVATYDQLVGPTNYIKALRTIAGEHYPLSFTQGETLTVTGVAGARTITSAVRGIMHNAATRSEAMALIHSSR